MEKESTVAKVHDVVKRDTPRSMERKWLINGYKGFFKYYKRFMAIANPYLKRSYFYLNLTFLWFLATEKWRKSL